MITPDLFLVLLGLIGIIYCWEKTLYMRHVVRDDQRRMELYRLRDRLHELVLSGGISDASKDYIITARFLHTIIGIHKEADFLFFCSMIIQYFRTTEEELKEYRLPEHRKTRQIVLEASAILLTAIAANSFFVRLSKSILTKMPYLIRRYKPVRAYESVDRFNQSLGVA